MSKNKNINIGCQLPSLGLVGSVLTTIIGQSIHGSFIWGVIDFIFWPLVWAKWLICKDVNMEIIKEAFSWFI